MNEALLRKWADELYYNMMDDIDNMPENLTDNELYYIFSKVAQKLLIDLTNWHWEDAQEEREQK